MNMKILGIETSCDETAASVIENGERILSNVVVSQIDIHAVYGGVVPEVAARSHIEAIIPVIDEAVKPVGWDNIDAIAVTTHPGLIGSLMIGVLTAKTLALTKNKPLYPINHIQAHVYANFLNSQPEFPILALIVSGGHTQIALFKNHEDYEILGQTRDDAVGEAFDKVAKILGLPYPGGPSIAKSAEHGDANKYHLPKPKLKSETDDTSLDFSFSGLKTALLRAVQAECGKDYTFPSSQLSGLLSDAQRNDFSASFQQTAIEILVDKMELAFNKYQPKSVVIAGGVASNSELRRMLTERLAIKINYPDPSFCTDNASMVASLAYYLSKTNPPTNPHKIKVTPTK